MRKHPIIQMAVIGSVITAILLPIALLVPWFPAQAATQASKIDTLYKVLLIASVPIFALVASVVIYSVWKFRMRPGQELKDGPPIHGNTRLEVMWTLAPTILIVGLCTYAYAVLHANEKVKPHETTIDVIGEQFAWIFSYPQGSGQAVVSNELYLPAGQPIHFRLHSRDVLHAFWVPAFREQLDAVPGITDDIRVTPTKVGTFPLVCAELCGNGHALMRAPVHVVTASQYQTWMAAQKPQPAPTYLFTPVSGTGAKSGAAASTTGGATSTSSGSAGGTSTTAAGAAAAAGKTIFTGSAGCSSCHTLADAGATGTVGPNLGTKLVGDAKKRGLPLAAFIQESIAKPNAYISPGYPSSLMPQTFSQTLTASQIQSLVAYLQSVTK